jgi:hypothetical protein
MSLICIISARAESFIAIIGICSYTTYLSCRIVCYVFLNHGWAARHNKPKNRYQLVQKLGVGGALNCKTGFRERQLRAFMKY